MKNKTWMAAIAIALALTLAGCSVNPGAQGTQPITVNLQNSAAQNVISVSATGTIKVMPDIAYVSAGVVTQDADAAKAQSDNTEAMTALFEALKGAGLTEDDIDTTNYTVYPMYDYSEGGNGRITAYEVTNTVRITVRDIKRVGEIITAAAENGANTNFSIAFTLEDEDAHYNEALTKAMEEAKAKADAIATAGGVSLGGVLSVSEGSYSYSPVYEYAAQPSMAADAGQETPVSAGELEVTATVSVVYSIG